jgi:galactofuranosylgalactofuranosylrhamnosyl-N-acetylglucosaminyl-diphospho-decaprenol beta-1,5/1,6-galactofuranosyltransferase
MNALLHKISTPANSAAGALYGCATPPECATADAERWRVAAGGEIDFDSFFNAFPAALWRSRTRVESVVLRLGVAGEGRAIVSACDHAGRTRIIAEQSFQSGAADATEIRIDLKNANANRISLKIQAAASVELAHAGFYADSALAEKLKLAIVICTYRREEALRENLTRLRNEPWFNEGDWSAFVVDNGCTLGPQDAGTKIRIIANENSGGAGGFSRGMFAAVEAGATHVILMDDDVLIDPESLRRAGALFAYARDEFLISGGMLDAMAPLRLTECGGGFRVRGLRTRSVLGPLDLAQKANLAPIFSAPPADYAAFWLCGVPTALIQRHGACLPIFIRGDDVEFGVRMKTSGAPTQTFPGVAVWHDPFYSKVNAWAWYYSARNFLLASLHSAAPAQWSALSAALPMIIRAVCFNMYDALRYMRDGFADFLAGPEGLPVSDPGAAHMAVMKRYQSDPERVAAPSPAARRDRIDQAPTVSSASPQWGRVLFKKRYIRRQPDGVELLYQRRMLTGFRLSLEILNLVLLHPLRWRKAAAAWRKSFPSLRDLQYWRTRSESYSARKS